jgi:hypothetical protein
MCDFYNSQRDEKGVDRVGRDNAEKRDVRQ